MNFISNYFIMKISICHIYFETYIQIASQHLQPLVLYCANRNNCNSWMIKQGRIHKKCNDLAYVYKKILHCMIVWKGMILLESERRKVRISINKFSNHIINFCSYSSFTKKCIPFLLLIICNINYWSTNEQTFVSYAKGRWTSKICY